jgi:hypothetical protein
MDVKEITLLGDSQENHWYYVSKSRALLAAVGDRRVERIADVGAGSGYFSKMLLRTTDADRAVCIDPGYTSDRLEMYLGKPLEFRHQGSIANADLVLLMDVLEHVDDDVGLVRKLAASANQRTRFVISVPAFSWLWSRHDEFLEHRRRYTLNGILRVIAAGGLSPVSGFYAFAAIFPAVAAKRLWARVSMRSDAPKSDLRRHHPWTNSLLTRVCLAECAIARYNRVFGLTAFVVAEKL